MSLPRLFGILILAVVALAGNQRASWGAQLVVGQDYHSVQLLSGTSAAAMQESLALVAGEPYARIDKRGAGYALRVGYWGSREEALQAAKALLPKFRGAHARIATYRPDAIVASAGEPTSGASAPRPATTGVSPASAAGAVEPRPKAVAQRPSTPEVLPPSVVSTTEPPSRAAAPAPFTPEVAPQRTEPAQTQAQGRDMRRGAQLVTGQDYYSVQLLSATSAAMLQKSLALVADQPYARIEKRGAEYVLRVGYWESRDEAAQAAKALLPTFRGAHTRIGPYQPEAAAASAGGPRPTVSSPPTVAQAPRAAVPETAVQAGAQSQRETAKLAAERAEVERQVEAARKERSAAEERARRETLVRQQAEAQAEAAARERAAAEREALAQAALREKAEAEALRLAESRRDAERRAAAAALARSAADERIAQEAAAKAQAQREAERVAQEKSAEQQRLIEQAQARERAETEALRLAESRREAERRAVPEVSPLRTEPVQAPTPVMQQGLQLVVGQDYHSVQLLSATSVAVLQKSLPLVADQPYARIDKRGAAYLLRVGYWDSRVQAVQAAKSLLRKFRGAHARIATYRPDAIVVWNGDQAATDSTPVASTPEVRPPGVASTAEPPSKAAAPSPSAPEASPPSIASAAEQPSKAAAPVPATPAISPPKTEPAQLQPSKPDPSRPVEYQLGAGDTIKVVVFQNPDLTIEARVTESGTISYPLIGEVKIGGMTISAAEQTIAKALKDGGFIQQPQVNIVLGQIRGYQVAVLGQVNRPGRFPLETTNIRVSEMIAIAGGITPATGADVAVLTGTRDGRPFRKEIDITSMFVDNKLQDDLVVAGGDVIFVQRAPMYYIYGEVQRPGSYRVERNMTVRQALAQGGGPTIRGTERWLRLHRRGADGKVEILKPGFDDLVQPEDVVYVRESIF